VKHQHQLTSTTKRNTKEKLLSPVVSKFAHKKELTEYGATLRTGTTKEKKGLKKGKQQKSQVKWKF
jgi:hypothetical protein